MATNSLTHVTHDTEMMVVIQSIDRKKVKHCSRPVRDGMLVETRDLKKRRPVRDGMWGHFRRFSLNHIVSLRDTNMFLLYFLPTFRP
ncbi:MAG: hypothetical protein LBJ00_00375 [Planctomycetaceae bacterium]|jgi:hypothetical protein|nr:hypothetical protein [Planctomycetaceae bacterium]